MNVTITMSEPHFGAPVGDRVLLNWKLLAAHREPTRNIVFRKTAAVPKSRSPLLASPQRGVPAVDNEDEAVLIGIVPHLQVIHVQYTYIGGALSAGHTAT